MHEVRATPVPFESLKFEVWWCTFICDVGTVIDICLSSQFCLTETGLPALKLNSNFSPFFFTKIWVTRFRNVLIFWCCSCNESWRAYIHWRTSSMFEDHRVVSSEEVGRGATSFRRCFFLSDFRVAVSSGGRRQSRLYIIYTPTWLLLLYTPSVYFYF
jgi:hypothetical protein